MENIRYLVLRLYLIRSVKVVVVVFVTYKFFNINYGFIWLDGINCIGIEIFIGLCGYNFWGINDCDYIEDIGVVC